nr:hypothetical protein [Tanacetum cinerariifolium]
MTSFGYRSNPLYAIKECSSCGTLYTRDCGYSKGNVKDKILVPKPPKNYARCTSYHSNPRYAIKECSSCGTLYTRDCGCSKGNVKDKILVPKPPKNCARCTRCGYLVDGPNYGIFCKQCTCKSCGKDTYIGYNCPSKVLVISNPEPCNNQTIDELPQTLLIFHPTFQSEAESPFTLDLTPTYVDESPNVFNPPPQSFVYPCEFCENDAYHGHYCTPQAPFIYPEPCYNHDFNFPQDFQNVPQQYPYCDDCGVTHDAYQCQPMNEVYYYGQNSCYDSTSIGFDKSQPQQYTVNHPIFNAHNSYLDSHIQLNSTLAKITDQMTSITSLCEMACQVVQKKLEEKQLEEERAAKAKYWKLPVCYDDDNDEERSDSFDDNIFSGLPLFSAITHDEPVLSTEEPDNSLSMGDEHLDTISVTKSDEFIKSSVENLIPIPTSNDNPIPFYDPIIFGTPPNLTPSGESDFFLDVDAFLAVEDEPTSSQFSRSYLDPEGDMLLFEAFLNDDHSFDFKTKSSSTFLNSLLEETNNFNNYLPEFTTFSKVLFDVEYEPDSSDDQSCAEEDVLEKIVSKPLSEEEIIPMKSLHFRLIEKLLYDNSSPRPPEEFVSTNSDAESESFSPSPILVKDSDSLMEEIDLLCTPDYPIPPGIKDKDYDFERDILIHKDLPRNNTLSFAEKESFYFDIPPFSRPPAKPPDGDTGILNIKMMDESTSSQFPKSDLDPEGDMLLFESFLNDDPSSKPQTKSSSTSLNSLLEETNNFHNSLPECTTFLHVLCDAKCESDSSDDQSCSDEDVLEKIIS